jgi:polysaccharide biosynthesis protein PslG
MMRRLGLWLVALAALLALPASAFAFLPPGFVGISPQNPLGHKDFELMREAGVDNVRLPMFWSGIEGKSPLVVRPDWSSFDKEVELAAEANVRIMPFVWASPEWVASEPIDLPVKTSWQRWAWQKFLREAARRYGPEGEFWEDHRKLDYLPITHWEIWNEENIVSFAEAPDPAEFAKLIRISGAALHGIDPESQVIVGGLFGRPLQVPPNVASGDYLKRIYAAGNVKPYFDGVGLHPYVARARAMGGQLNNLRRIMRANGDAKTPIYITELGWGSASGPTRWQRGVQGQADQLSRSLEMLSENRTEWKVNGVWWFTWTDEGGTCIFCGSAGLLTRHYEAKPSWYRFVEWTGGEPEAVPEASGDE